MLPYQLGQDLGYSKLPEELTNKGESVGGIVEYLLRNITMTIDDHQFSAPIAWLQTPHCEEVLIGREVVFDLFEFNRVQEEAVWVCVYFYSEYRYVLDHAGGVSFFR